MNRKGRRGRGTADERGGKEGRKKVLRCLDILVSETETNLAVISLM